MSETNFWQLIVTIAISCASSLVIVVYRDTIRRISNVERKVSAVLMAQLLLLGRTDAVPTELLKAIQEAITEKL